jgi:hypothetical protein
VSQFEISVGINDLLTKLVDLVTKLARLFDGKLRELSSAPWAIEDRYVANGINAL